MNLRMVGTSDQATTPFVALKNVSDMILQTPPITKIEVFFAFLIIIVAIVAPMLAILFFGKIKVLQKQLNELKQENKDLLKKL